MNVNQSKQFLLNEVTFRLTITGAFQRNSVYSRKLSQFENKHFKSFLKSYLASNLRAILENPNYCDEHHYKSIRGLSNLVSKKYSALLNNGRFTIGTAQKVLNLYWKTHWLFNKNVPEPIHCPFDGVIIGQLTPDVRHIKWTRIENIREYKKLVSSARRIAGRHKLGEWELVTYNQRNFTNSAIG